MDRPSTSERPSSRETGIYTKRRDARKLNGYTEDYPGLVVILIDQSDSMNDPWSADFSDTKADRAREAVNQVCVELTAKCRLLRPAREDQSQAWERKVFLLIMGYQRDANGDPVVNELKRGWPDQFGGTWSQDGRPVYSPNALRWECSGDTPMAEALAHVHRAIDALLEEEPKLGSGFAPCVLHISDGEADDFKQNERGEMGEGKETEAAAKELCGRVVNGDNIAFLNILIRSDAKGTGSIVFPDKAPAGTWSGFLWRISSDIPFFIRRKLDSLNRSEEGPYVPYSPQSKGLVITDEPGMLVQFLRWGTIDK